MVNLLTIQATHFNTINKVKIYKQIKIAAKVVINQETLRLLSRGPQRT